MGRGSGAPLGTGTGERNFEIDLNKLLESSEDFEYQAALPDLT